MEHLAGLNIETIANPLDLIEEYFGAHEWTFDRATPDDLLAQLQGRWDDYRLHFAWNSEIGAMQFTCALDFKVPPNRRNAVYELLSQVNERLWMGHFFLSSDDRTPMYRVTVPLRGARGLTVEQVEDMVDTAVTDCERFYPAFQFVIWGGRPAAEAIAAACIDPIGEA